MISELDHDGRYKLSIHLMTSDALYDLQSGRAEMNNLIDSAAHAEVRNRLHDKLLDWMRTSRDPFRGYYWGRRTWRPDFPETWNNAGFTRQRESDGYLPRELDYDTGLGMVQATRPKNDGSMNSNPEQRWRAKEFRNSEIPQPHPVWMPLLQPHEPSAHGV